MNELYKLDKERLDWLTDKTNRSNGQTQFLYNLLEGDFEKLVQLEMQLRNCLCGYCPGDMEEVEKVLKMKPSGNVDFYKNTKYDFDKIKDILND